MGNLEASRQSGYFVGTRALSAETETRELPNSSLRLPCTAPSLGSTLIENPRLRVLLAADQPRVKLRASIRARALVLSTSRRCSAWTKAPKISSLGSLRPGIVVFSHGKATCPRPIISLALPAEC
ncbi:hypothetical protein TgHK011_006408 [Trichoderma gracile]|nr:hypothetical protein TgHK011_006408 [Trichoderma gracile]